MSIGSDCYIWREITKYISWKRVRLVWVNPHEKINCILEVSDFFFLLPFRSVLSMVASPAYWFSLFSDWSNNIYLSFYYMRTFKFVWPSKRASRLFPWDFKRFDVWSWIGNFLSPLPLWGRRVRGSLFPSWRIFIPPPKQLLVSCLKKNHMIWTSERSSEDALLWFCALGA